jgi:hypothetical protein
MRVKILQRGEKPLIIEGFDQLVVETDGGAPVAVVSRYGPEGSLHSLFCRRRQKVPGSLTFPGTA